MTNPIAEISPGGDVPPPASLGTKGKSGILCDVESRRDFLSDASHRVRFVFTPKHCSWLNQVEIWFGILARRALKRASFKSVEELDQAIRDFIEYFSMRQDRGGRARRSIMEQEYKYGPGTDPDERVPVP